MVGQHNNYTENRQLQDIVGTWNPFLWGRLYSFHTSSFGKKAKSFDAENFWKENADRSERFGLLLHGDERSDAGYY